MYKVSSTTASEETKAKQGADIFRRRYHNDNGKTGEITISDPLLDNDAVALQRAKSEFLKHGYRQKVIEYTTHDLEYWVNMLINVDGKWYIVKNLTFTVQDGLSKTRVKAIRYET